ncbi:MAG: F0F1 ATP synthase subunit B [Ruminococcaceae bacterium]|nr:F0F1 ATP synthase subunit B [Oscillospiraceae bacterium]
MQSLAIISVNLWQILISIANLIILFLLIKKFLYKPVQKMLAERQSALDKLYSDADNAKEKALLSEQEWKEKLDGADHEAEAIIQKATDTASWRSEKMIEEAKEKADGIIRQAETAADLYRKQATDDIKQEIVNVSAVLTEKLLEREINMDDHKNLIDSVIEQIGDDHD